MQHPSRRVTHIIARHLHLHAFCVYVLICKQIQYTRTSASARAHTHTHTQTCTHKCVHFYMHHTYWRRQECDPYTWFLAQADPALTRARTQSHAHAHAHTSSLAFFISGSMSGVCLVSSERASYRVSEREAGMEGWRDGGMDGGEDCVCLID